jgi:hypothetical protein
MTDDINGANAMFSSFNMWLENGAARENRTLDLSLTKGVLYL